MQYLKQSSVVDDLDIINHSIYLNECHRLNNGWYKEPTFQCMKSKFKFKTIINPHTSERALAIPNTDDLPEIYNDKLTTSQQMQADGWFDVVVE